MLTRLIFTRRHLLCWTKLHVRLKSSRATRSEQWTSSKTRSAFLSYFQEQNHLFVPSSSVIPHKLQGTYFTNAGMNQFKPLFLGTADPQSEMLTYKRVVNSQKCIRVGGKHNDLEEVGQDLTHHTFFEMLGNWSFGDYFKEDACRMAMEVLTSVYGLPLDRLYFTYFAGSQDLNLQPDTECRDIWRSLGIPPDRILPFDMRDNFWDMGDTGPCGPCTEIHFDHVGGRNVPALVNADCPEVVEIWNLVFMQYQRHEDGSLSSLPRCHVDTGMGLERLVAVLNCTRSNYNTDLFLPLFTAIQQASGVEPYTGRVGEEDIGGLDTAYRVLADHARMYTTAITDGLMPSRNGLGHKLRQLMHRCVRLSQNTFHTDPLILCDLVDHVATSLGGAFPEIQNQKELVKSVVTRTVEGYLQLQREARQSFRKLLRHSNCHHLTGEMIWQLNEGRYGCSTPVDMIMDLAEEHRVTLDLPGFHQHLQKQKTLQSRAPVSEKGPLSQQCYTQLQQAGVGTTDDSYKYLYTSSSSGYDFSEGITGDCRVLGLVQAQTMTSATAEGASGAVLLDKTCFYAEGGGQMADVGMLFSKGGQFAVEDVQVFNRYVLHLGRQVSGSLCTGDMVQPCIDQDRRLGSMRNHTATHLLQCVLRQVLGPSVSQQGSNVRHDRLSFDFLCLENLSNEKLSDIESRVRGLIGQGHRVHRHQMSLQEALDYDDVLAMANEDYPSEVTLVEIGDQDSFVSRELCGGTHVLNTSDMEEFCIMRVTSVSQGVRRVVAVTGPLATQVHKKGSDLNALCEEFSALVSSQTSTAAELRDKSHCIKQILATDLLPHTVRERAAALVETLAQYVTAAANREKQVLLLRDVEHLLRDYSDKPFIVNCMKFDGKQMVKAVSSLVVDKPIALLSSDSKSTVLVLLCPPDQASGDLQDALKSAVGGSKPVKLKRTENREGVSVMIMTVKGSGLQSCVEHSVTDFLDRWLTR